MSLLRLSRVRENSLKGRMRRNELVSGGRRERGMEE
jgi:hypothetical protein